MRPFTAVFTLTAGLVLVSVTPATALLQTEMSLVAQQSTPPQDSGIGIRLVDVPAATQNDPRARSYIIDNLQPGEKIERRVEVQNNTTSPQAVSIYAGSARIDGNSFVGDDRASINELTSWTTVDKPKLNLGAGQSVDVLVSISVPSSATDGERYAALWAEVRSVADAGNNIVSASRVGIRMYISVGSGNGPSSDFSIGPLSANRSTKGIAEIQTTVANTGGRALDLSGTLSLANGPSGLSAGPFETTTMTTLAPGETGVLTVVLGADIPAGPWDARLELRSGLLTHDVSARLTFANAKLEKAAPSEPTWNVAFISIVAGVVALLVVAAVFVALNRMKRRSRQ